MVTMFYLKFACIMLQTKRYKYLTPTLYTPVEFCYDIHNNMVHVVCVICEVPRMYASMYQNCASTLNFIATKHTQKSTHSENLKDIGISHLIKHYVPMYVYPCIY